MHDVSKLKVMAGKTTNSLVIYLGKYLFRLLYTHPLIIKCNRREICKKKSAFINNRANIRALRLAKCLNKTSLHVWGGLADFWAEPNYTVDLKMR